MTATEARRTLLHPKPAFSMRPSLCALNKKVAMKLSGDKVCIVYSEFMQRFCEPFKEKKITLMGLGVLGRGVGDAEFLASCGAAVIVTDKKSGVELAASVARLKKFPNITYHLGGHRIEDFTNADMVIQAAGVPLDSPEIQAARERGVPVYMSTALFAKYAMEQGAIVVGVTGTRGKTTTASMIYHTLKNAGKSVLLGGNVRGQSTLAKLPQLYEDSPHTHTVIVVLELDSWQLQGFGDLRISPHIAVVTNLMPDHQNYYKDMGEYFADKANIFRYQRPGDFLFVGVGVLERVEAARPAARPRVPPAIPQDWRLIVLGEHNRENASLAAAALTALGIAEGAIREGLESFEAVEGRLQLVREIGGVKIFNDNNATTPEATIAALSSLHGSVALIVGGSEKGLDLKTLVADIEKRAAATIVLTHAQYRGSERLKRDLRDAGAVFKEATSLERALVLAMEAKPGAILFSPGFASFGMFKNEYDRNDEFVRLVKSL